jgi:hypothetical protein
MPKVRFKTPSEKIQRADLVLASLPGHFGLAALQPCDGFLVSNAAFAAGKIRRYRAARPGVAGAHCIERRLYRFLRARKRSQATRILNDLRMIDSADDQYAIETNRTTGATVNVADWTNYVKKGSVLYNTGTSILGSTYGQQTVDSIPQVPTADLNALSDVAGTGFWSPYGP